MANRTNLSVGQVIEYRHTRNGRAVRVEIVEIREFPATGGSAAIGVDGGKSRFWVYADQIAK